MDQRPLSVSVVAWIILIISILGIISFISMRQQIFEHMALINAPVHIYYLGLVSRIIDLICALFMLRAANWSRLFYLAWGIIVFIYSLVVLQGTYLGPVIFAIVFFIIFNIFLFSRSANAYFGQGKTTHN